MPNLIEEGGDFGIFLDSNHFSSVLFGTYLFIY